MYIEKHIEQLIANDLECGELESWHGITLRNLREHLIKPKKEVYVDSCELSVPAKSILESILQIVRLKKQEYKEVHQEHSLYTVFHEYPSQKEGYIVAYSQEDNNFYLCSIGTDGIKYIDSSGNSFVEVLNAM